jgi:hypothetical protein
MSELSEILGTTRFGKIQIDITTINGAEQLVLSAMARMIPISTTYHKETQMIEYVATSSDFDELDPKELIPLYTIINYSDNSVEFKRLTFKRKIEESVKDEIMQVIMDNNIYMEDFKRFIGTYQKVSEEDFKAYDENLLEALRIYVNRRDNGKAS